MCARIHWTLNVKCYHWFQLNVRSIRFTNIDLMGAMFIEHQRTASSLPPQTVFEPDKWFSVYTASQERERERDLIWNHMKLIINGQERNWSTNTGLDILMEKQDNDIRSSAAHPAHPVPCVQESYYVDLSTADWHMSLSFLLFINLHFLDLLGRFVVAGVCHGCRNKTVHVSIEESFISNWNQLKIPSD